ncbi:MAG: hypothetical protein WC480_01395 [Patescibacteria group bacterium]
MAKKIFFSIILLFTLSLLVAPALVFAEKDDLGVPWEEGEATVWDRMRFGLQPTEKIAYGIEGEVRIPLLLDTVMYLVQVFLTTLGVIFVIIVVYAGFRWMTAGGNQEQVTEARKLLINATIGLAIVIMSLSITYFIVYALLYSSRGTKN